MSFARAYNPVLHFDDDNGHPLAGGWLYTYLAGTNIPVATAANESGSSMNPVQIHLDSRGECEAWLDPAIKYKFELWNSDRTWHQVKDNVTAPGVSSSSAMDILIAAVKSHTIAIEGLAHGKKNKQQAKVISGTPTQTVKRFSQNADGEIDVEFEEIDFPYNIEISSPDDSIEIGTPEVDPELKKETIPISVKSPGLVKANPEDTNPNTLIDKLEVVDTVRDPEDPDDPPLLSLETTVDVQGNRKVAINEDNLRTFKGTLLDELEYIINQINELPNDEHGYFNSSLYTTPGDGTTESILMDNFRISEGRSVHGDSIEFVPTHQEGEVDFGEVYLNPGTYILNVHYTLQYVGNPRGTFHPLVTNVGEQPFDFSYEHEDILRSTRIVTRSTRGKFGLSFPFDADTPPMGIWVKYLEIAQIASYNHPAVTHDTTLAGSGQIGDPLGVTPAAFGKVKNIPASISQFRNGDVIPVDGPNGPAKMPASDLQDAILGGPIDEAVQAWLDEHPEATTTVQDGSLTKEKFSNTLKLQTLKDYVTPEMFGAIGDGITDDFDAVKAAVLSGHPVNLIGKTYRCRAGETIAVSSSLFLYNGKLLIDSSENFFIFIEVNSLDAEVHFCNVFVESTKDKACTDTTFQSSTLCSNVFFLHGNLCGKGVFDFCSFENIDHPIKMDSTNQYIFSNCSFDAFIQGIYLNGFLNTRVENCRFNQDLQSNTHYHCIYFAGQTNIDSYAEIVNCNFYGAAYPIHLYSDNSNRPKTAYISGCVIESATSTAIVLTSATTYCKADIFGSKIKGQYGIVVGGECNLYGCVIEASVCALINGLFYLNGCNISNCFGIEQAKIVAENCNFYGQLYSISPADASAYPFMFKNCSFIANANRPDTHYISVRYTNRNVYFDKCIFDSCYKSGSSTARVFYNPSYTGTLSMINCIFYCTLIGVDGYTADPSTNLSIQLPVRLNVPF